MTGEYKEDQKASPEEGARESTRESKESAKGYLYLAALMMALAVAAYTFEGALYDMAGSSSAFVFALVLPVLAALFFVYCYRNPRFGRKMMGHSAPLVDKKQRAGGLSYNIFKGESGAQEKLAGTRRKSARHLRKQLGRATAEVAEEASESTEPTEPDDDSDEKSS